jgi:hypothetical protein
MNFENEKGDSKSLKIRLISGVVILSMIFIIEIFKESERLKYFFSVISVFIIFDIFTTAFSIYGKKTIVLFDLYYKSTLLVFGEIPNLVES